MDALLDEQPITFADLERPSDLLMRWDRWQARSEGYANLLPRLEPLRLASAFDAHARNREARALLELELNGAVPWEAFERLRRFSYASVAPRPFRTLVRLAHGATFWDVRFGERPHRRPRRLNGRPDIERVLGGAVQGYLVRHLGGGVVLRRDLLEQALDLPDWPVLRLAVDPRTGEPLLDGLARDLPLWDELGPKDVEAARRERLGWWTRPDRGAAVHDLAPAPAPTPRAAAKTATATDPARAAAVPPPGRAEADELRALRARYEALREGLHALLHGLEGEEDGGGGAP